MSLISAAYAAPDAAHAAHDVGFFSQPETWVAITFLLIVGWLWRPVYRLISTALDKRSDSIRARLDEAEKLADEAQKLLVSFQKKQHDSAKEVEDMLQKAHAAAEYFAKEGQKNLEESLARREKLAMERLVQAEKDAVREVEQAAVDIAMRATERVLAKLPASQGQKLLEEAIKDLPQRLH